MTIHLLDRVGAAYGLSSYSRLSIATSVETLDAGFRQVVDAAAALN